MDVLIWSPLQILYTLCMFMLNKLIDWLIDWQSLSVCVCQSTTVQRVGGLAEVTSRAVVAGCGLNKVECDRCPTGAGPTESRTLARRCTACCSTRTPATAGTMLPVQTDIRSSVRWTDCTRHPHQFSCSNRVSLLDGLWDCVTSSSASDADTGSVSDVTRRC